MIKAVLFDFWGTLAYHETHPALVRLEDAFKDREKKEKKIIQTIVMEEKNTVEQIQKKLLKQFSFSKTEWDRIQFFLKTNDVQLYADVFPTLLMLKEKGIKIGLVSNSQSAGLNQVIESSGLEKIIDQFSWSFDVKATKPSPIIFHHALKKLKVKKSETVMVGDSLGTDILGAKASGLYAILLDRTGKMTNPKESDFKAESLLDVVTWIEHDQKEKESQKINRK